MPEPEPRAEGFREVLWAEIKEVEQSRELRGLTAQGVVSDKQSAGKPLVPETKLREIRTVYSEAGHHNFLGLALSGGGIRSTTFNLGVLQALAKYGLIPRFDYLSAVSGGGYIGSWFTSWIKRTDRKTVAAGLKHGKPKDRTSEPPEITYLRRFSNYLTPKTGALSADTWTGAAIYIRNVFLNLTILVLALTARV
jgi:predicted acylesterase/phospholipase RssA